jgi:hypothetical protein
MSAALIASSAMASNGNGGGGQSGPSKIQLVTPTITCNGSTGESITLHVCAGSTGAPAGFSIHIETLADWQANGWSESNSSYRCVSLGGNCQGGNNPWSLAPNACTDVIISANILDYYAGLGICGVSTDCGVPTLLCGTTYVFRIFAHGDSDHILSDKGPDPPLACSTAACPVGGCTLTWGYWKTHGPDPDCSPGNQSNEWNVASLTIGGQSVSAADLCGIFHENPGACGKGTGANAVVILEHQLIAAMLNVANGAISCPFANSAISQANTLLVGHVNDCVGASSVLGQQMIAVAGLLDTYNSDNCSCPVAAPAPSSSTAPTETHKASWGQVKSIYR